MDLQYHIDYVGFANPNKDRSCLKDTMGRYRTNLFLEFNTKNQEQYPPLYTMKDLPENGLPSAYLIYMNSNSEYEAAMKLVGSWAHWKRLMECPPFMDGLKETSTWNGLKSWREEKEIKERAQIENMLLIQAVQGNVAAQKILYEKDKPSNRRGRPSKAEIERAAREAAEHTKVMKDDLDRIRLVANNGK